MSAIQPASFDRVRDLRRPPGRCLGNLAIVDFHKKTVYERIHDNQVLLSVTVCVCIYICMYMYLYVHVHVHVHVHVDVDVDVDVDVCVCVHVCIYIYIYVKIVRPLT